ncbi:MAG: agmatine deiminase family protein [Cyanobacteria bacterium P01_D01_bin.105]
MNSFVMPEESDRHKRTWMSFVANDNIWSRRQIPAVKRDLALIATTIAKYEPVSMLVGPDDYREAVSLLGGLDAHTHPIELLPFATDDLWLRDTGPTFVRGRDGQKYGINFNFNGWGNKQEHTLDAQVADFITERANAIIQTTPLVLEGGCFEIDGYGTAILTKSSVLNDNRNPGMSQADVEEALKALLGLRKIIWLEGIRGRDITDGHIDFYGRFSKKGEVIASRDNDPGSFDYAVTRENIEVLKAATDADNNPLNVIVMDVPDSINEAYGVSDFAAGYVGYYVCNDAIIMQKFGDSAADDNARALLTTAFPNRTIEQISIDGIASGGGSIHCATQQEPKI